jgi:hypothetical protein
VILGCLCNCGSPQTSHAWQKNPMAALKKKRSDFYTSVFCKVRALIVGQNPFSQRENLPNTGETQLVPTGEIDQKIDPSVTTNHLLLAIHRRRATSLLPFSQPISHVADSHSQREPSGGRGVRRAHPAKVLRSKSAHGNFIPIGSPAPFLLLSKKSAAEPVRDSEPSRPALSRELAANHR